MATDGGSLFMPPAEVYKRLPFGEQQGSFRGVVACSNRDDGFFSGENNYIHGTIYTGFRYQCVEYARRFLILTTGCIFEDCGRASEIFGMKHITNVETGATIPLVAHRNRKSTRKPAAGDILIYPYNKDLTPWGHVGIISYVDDAKVGIAEQNQYFGQFVSPHPDYLGGENCVARFAELVFHEETGVWEIRDSSNMPPCLGWMSYDGTTSRPIIYEPLNPLPAFIKIRSTPIDSPEHPYIYQLNLTAGYDITTGTVRHIVGTRRGNGEVLVAAATATARVLRFTLQFLFHSSNLCESFLALAFNPLGAEMPSHSALEPLFAAIRQLGIVRDDDALVPALAEYFQMPAEWLHAMRREFHKREHYMCADASFDFQAIAEDVAKVASDPEGASENVYVIRGDNPHDEVWHLCKVSFQTLRMQAELPGISSILPQLRTAADILLPGYDAHANTHYRMDFINYIKEVEENCGPRTAFTIVTAPNMEGQYHELVSTLTSYCTRVKYPVRVVAENNLVFDPVTGKLFAYLSDATPVMSPTTKAPIGDYEVNFVMAISEWEDILRAPNAHRALYNAALAENSDVVFAKPLWTYLCSGVMNYMLTPDQRRVEASSPAVKFFDIVRWLYTLATPKQDPATWNHEVSEYKDSCRRLRITTPVPQEPTAHFVGNVALVNYACSAMMAHYGRKVEEDGHSTAEEEGNLAPIMFFFSKAD